MSLTWNLRPAPCHPTQMLQSTVAACLEDGTPTTALGVITWLILFASFELLFSLTLMWDPSFLSSTYPSTHDWMVFNKWQWMEDGMKADQAKHLWEPQLLGKWGWKSGCKTLKVQGQIHPQLMPQINPTQGCECCLIGARQHFAVEQLGTLLKMPLLSACSYFARQDYLKQNNDLWKEEKKKKTHLTTLDCDIREWNVIFNRFFRRKLVIYQHFI